MPIYEYRCSACGFQKEYLQKVSDAPPVTCPECGKESLAKMVTAAGFQLKGSGWSKADSASGSKSDAKPDAKSEAKPDAKSEARTEPKANPSPPTPSAT
jgi:putative FmdB family regulatory protein